MDSLNEREFELINIVGARIATSQRDLSQHLSLSLGLTNMLIRRLMSKGYIRIRQLNKRKVEYILTPKGFAEKYQKSIKYTVKTINSIGLIRQKLNKLIKALYDKGERRFYILGESDLAILVEMALKPLVGIEQEKIKVFPTTPLPGVIIICREEPLTSDVKQNAIDLIQELAKDQELASSLAGGAG